MEKILNNQKNDIGFRKKRQTDIDNLYGDTFLQSAFGECFRGLIENIAKNYSVLSKDILISKEGVEVDVLIPSRMAECLQIALNYSKQASRKFRKWNLIPTMVCLCSSINTKN